ncbi:MAG: bacillithiol biosynthesis BshC [Holophagaceae bacterium]|nr:bacillithiol biosynthesis BshC [Holophagaceae bacterium]
MKDCKGVIVTGQQIGAGWSPALSVVKALTAYSVAKQRGLEPVYWLADEDHDRLEVANVVAFHGNRIIRHRFQFSAPEGTATGWLEWTKSHQSEAQSLWGKLPEPTEPTLREHVLALGKPLWDRGIVPFSPTKDIDRISVQAELERWRAMELEKELCQRASILESKGEQLILDPLKQSTWFSLDPTTGKRSRLEHGQAFPTGHWLSPGAAIRPLLQSLVLPVEAVVLGPGERAYWQLIERVWERVGIKKPQIIPRPSVYVLDGNSYDISVEELDALRLGRWEALAPTLHVKPSTMAFPEPSAGWGVAISNRYQKQIELLQTRLQRLDLRLAKEVAEKRIGKNIEKLRQTLFPFNKPQERVIPGWYWLKNKSLLDALEKAMLDAKEKHLIIVDEQETLYNGLL